jgi:hypothetical protein
MSVAALCIFAILLRTIGFIFSIRLHGPLHTLADYAYSLVLLSMYIAGTIALPIVLRYRCNLRSWLLWPALLGGQAILLTLAYDMEAHALPGHPLPTLDQLAPGFTAAMNYIGALTFLAVVIVLAMTGRLRPSPPPQSNRTD